MIKAIIMVLLVGVGPLRAQSPYKLDWAKDGLIMGGSLGVAIVGATIDDSLTIPTRAEIAGLDKSTINGFDRWATQFSSRGISDVSDVLAVTAAASPVLMTLGDGWMRMDAVTIGTMYVETMLLATFLPSFGKGTVTRYRPYAYNPKTPDDPLYTEETTRSFFSGHSTVAFASMTFLANVYSDYYYDSDYKTAFWIGSMGVASSVALLRVFSGAHFPTDILVGSAVGFGVGNLIPWLHRSGVNLEVAPNIETGSLMFRYHTTI